MLNTILTDLSLNLGLKKKKKIEVLSLQVLQAVLLERMKSVFFLHNNKEIKTNQIFGLTLFSSGLIKM